MEKCNCVKRLQEKLKKQSDEIENVLIDNYELLSQRGYSDFNVFVKGKKKPVQTHVIHGWCPFCGRKYDDL